MEGAQGQGNNGPEGHRGATGTEAPEEITRIPMTMQTRIMRQALPEKFRISTDAKEATSRCVSEFAAVLTREAARVAKEESRRTLSGDDIIAALARLGFTDYIDPLSLLPHRFRESQGIERCGWQAELPPPAPAAVVAAQVEMQQPPPPTTATATAEVEMLQPPEQDLTLRLALTAPRDVTELGLHEDVYKVWPRAAGPMPPAAGRD